MLYIYPLNESICLSTNSSIHLPIHPLFHPYISPASQPIICLSSTYMDIYVPILHLWPIHTLFFIHQSAYSSSFQPSSTYPLIHNSFILQKIRELIISHNHLISPTFSEEKRYSYSLCLPKAPSKRWQNVLCLLSNLQGASLCRGEFQEAFTNKVWQAKDWR